MISFKLATFHLANVILFVVVSAFIAATNWIMLANERLPISTMFIASAREKGR